MSDPMTETAVVPALEDHEILLIKLFWCILTRDLRHHNLWQPLMITMSLLLSEAKKESQLLTHTISEESQSRLFACPNYRRYLNYLP